MGCDAICIFAIRVQNKYTLCIANAIGWEQINSIISTSSVVIRLTSIIIENIFLITSHPNITSSSKGEVFVLGSLISVSTHSSLLALSSTWLSSPHHCHHHDIDHHQHEGAQRQMRKSKSLWIATRHFNQHRFTLTSCDKTCNGGKRMKSSVPLFCAQGMRFYTTCTRGYWEWQGGRITIYLQL